MSEKVINFLPNTIYIRNRDSYMNNKYKFT